MADCRVESCVRLYQHFSGYAFTIFVLFSLQVVCDTLFIYIIFFFSSLCFIFIFMPDHWVMTIWRVLIAIFCAPRVLIEIKWSCNILCFLLFTLIVVCLFIHSFNVFIVCVGRISACRWFGLILCNSIVFAPLFRMLWRTTLISLRLARYTYKYGPSVGPSHRVHTHTHCHFNQIFAIRKDVTAKLVDFYSKQTVFTLSYGVNIFIRSLLVYCVICHWLIVIKLTAPCIPNVGHFWEVACLKISLL